MMPSMPQPVARMRCYNHPLREAAALCTVTGKPFCRECIVEHEGRMVSAAVVAELLAKKEKKAGGWWAGAVSWLVAGCSLFLIVWAFMLLGKILTSLPHAFHEGRWGG